MQIYLARNQVQAGPYTLDQVNNMLATQQVDFNDLMWHEGMDEWQRVGDLTNETYHYNPNGTYSTNSHKKSAGRTSVAALYGRKEAHPTQENQNRSGNPKLFKQPNQAPRSGQPTQIQRVKSSKAGDFVQANVINRILGALIDYVLCFVCWIPLLSGMTFDYPKLEAASKDPVQLSNLTQQMVAAVPTHLHVMTELMFVALVTVQIFMLLRRGQTLGKLITGTRILDVNSHRLPSLINIILLRSVLTILVYMTALSFSPVIGLAVIAADLMAMIVDKRNRSLHDQLAKTYVVKATESQIPDK